MPIDRNGDQEKLRPIRADIHQFFTVSPVYCMGNHMAAQTKTGKIRNPDKNAIIYKNIEQVQNPPPISERGCE
jgi:hypothetical protein